VNLPVPARLKLFVKLKIAKALGLDVPLPLLCKMQVDKVIE